MFWAFLAWGRLQRSRCIVSACKAYLRTARVRVAKLLEQRPCASAGLEIPCAPSSLQASPCGTFLHGLPRLLSALPRKGQRTLIHCWFALVEEGLVEDDLDSGRHKFDDVVTFVCLGWRVGMREWRDHAPLWQRHLHALGRSIFQYLARQMDRYVLEVYLREHPADKPALSLRSKTWAQKEVYCRSARRRF